MLVYSPGDVSVTNVGCAHNPKCCARIQNSVVRIQNYTRDVAQQLVFCLCSAAVSGLSSCTLISQPIPTDIPAFTPSEGPDTITPTPSEGPDTVMPTPSEGPDTFAPTSSENPDITTHPDDIPTPLPSQGIDLITEGADENMETGFKQDGGSRGAIDESLNIIEIISFGMTRDEVVETLLANGFSPDDFSGTQCYSTLDNGPHETLDTVYHAFTFDKSGILYNFITSQASTARGFTPGENITRMAEIYGDDYRKCNFSRDYWNYDYDQFFYEYEFNGYYLIFYTYKDTDTIETWEISRYSFEDSWNTEGEG